MNKALLIKVAIYAAVALGGILLYKKVAKVAETVDKLPGFGA